MRSRRGVRWCLGLRPRGEEVEVEVDDEIRLHLELRAERLMARGVPESEAWSEAERRFGDPVGARRELRRLARRREDRVDLRERLSSWRQDLRYSARGLVREPFFALVVVFTMALGIGANATMFGIIDRLLLRGPTHVTDPEHVRRAYVTTRPPSTDEVTHATFGYVTYDLLRNVRAFEGVGAYALRDARLGRGPDAREIRLGYATWDLFPLLGVQPVLGRFFGADEDRPGDGRKVVVVNEGFWRSELGGGADVLGSAVTVNDETYTIIGVAPRGFTGPQLEPVALWAPMTASPPASPDWPTTWEAQWLQVVVRLRPELAREAAAQEATAAYLRAYDGSDLTDVPPRLSFLPLHYSIRGEEPAEVRVTKWLVGVSGIVLLIACANVTNLMLARGLRRRREIGVRVALGIARGRLVRLLLSESLLLAAVGGASALAVAYFGSRFMRLVLLPDVAWTESPLSGRVLALSAALALLVGLATGLLPALRSTRGDLTAALKSGAREGGGRRSYARSALTVAQAALAVVLLVGAGLFVRSLTNVRGLDLGLEPDRVLAVSLRWAGMTGLSEEMAAAERARRARTWLEALDRVRAAPDVESAAITIGTPFRSWFTTRLRVPGRDSVPRLPGGGPYLAAVSDGYFETTGVRIVRGRPFTAGDREGSEAVVIVNETMAATLWPGADPLGECLLIGTDPEACARVVGVAEVARRAGLREDASMQYYVPLGQERGIGGMTLLVRPRSAVAAAAPALRATLFTLDPTLSYVEVAPMQEWLDPQIRPWRLGATMFTLFGGLALLIAAVGLYSVIAYGVTQRTAELGIRRALGARGHDIIGMVVRGSVALVLLGIGLGAVLASLAGHWLEGLLFETSTNDPATFAIVAAALLGVAILASLAPALRAARVDPLSATRAE